MTKGDDLISHIEVNVKELRGCPGDKQRESVDVGAEKRTAEDAQDCVSDGAISKRANHCNDGEDGNEKQTDSQVQEKECFSLFCPPKAFNQKAQAEVDEPDCEFFLHSVFLQYSFFVE